MKLPDLRRFTSARVGLGRAGHALRTADMLQLQLAEVYAREAVHSTLDIDLVKGNLHTFAGEIIVVQSKATDRTTYIQRPDWGRSLNDASRVLLEKRQSSCDVVFVLADGLSSNAVHLHAASVLQAMLPSLADSNWQVAPIVLVQQGRVAIADEIGELLGASLSVVLIGERPGMSASDSLGAYLTWHPRSGLSDANRNCISNIRKEGLGYAAAAHRLTFLMNEARRLKLSGVGLKESADDLLSPVPDPAALPAMPE